MENLCRNIEMNDTYSLIGDKDQILQIIIKKYDGIVFKKQNLYYMSSTELEECLYHNLNSLVNSTETHPLGIRVKDNNLIRLKNQKSTFEYLGIYGGGRIMKVNPFLYKDLFVRYDCLIAFTENLDLLDVVEIRNKIERFHKPDALIQKDHKFYMISSNKCKDISEFTLTDYAVLKEFAYLTNENLLMEKRLGKNEEITIKSNTLVCFERTVSFNKIEDIKYKYINKNEYFTIQGPGLIIFELNHQNTKKLEVMKNFKLIAILSMIFTFLLFSHYLLQDFKYL